MLNTSTICHYFQSVFLLFYHDLFQDEDTFLDFSFFRKVYKIEVKSQNKSWFVFRRYTDFTRLNERVSGGVNPLYPKTSIHILHTPLYVFPLKLTWRICLTIKASQDGNNFL